MFDKKLISLLGRDNKYIVGVVVCNVFATVASVVFAFAIAKLVELASQGTQGAIFYLVPALFAVAAMVFRFISALLKGSLTAKLGTKGKANLRRTIFNKMVDLGVRETDELSIASLSQLAIEGLEQLDQYYSIYMPQFFTAIISPVLLCIVLMLVSFPSGIVMLICIPIIVLLLKINVDNSNKAFYQYWTRYNRMSDIFFDQISGMNDLKIYGADQACQFKMNDETERFKRITMKALRKQIVAITIMDIVAYIGAAAGLAFAFVMNEYLGGFLGLSVPTLLLFMVLILPNFYQPIRDLAASYNIAMNGAVVGKKILSFLDSPVTQWGDEKMIGFDIKMSRVSFSYDNYNPTLIDVSLNVEPGTMVAIVGQSGCGKSTVFNLLTGLRQCQTGQIYFGGIPIDQLSREDFYKHVGLVTYNTYIFNDSIRQNFMIGNARLKDEEIMEYLRMVNLDEFVTDNGGLNMIIDEDARNISSGQRQRLALAVSLAANKDIYFFDEITSNVDIASEKIIMDNIIRLAQEKTVILVSHRLKNARAADRIYVLDQGRLVDAGKHSTLMKHKGLYANIYTEQRRLEDSYKGGNS